MKKTIAASLFYFLSITLVFAQAQILKSFGYASVSCTNTPATLLTFDGAAHWRMCSGTDPIIGATCAAAGSGVFPTGNFWLRAVSVFYLDATAANWGVVGHGGSNGDWVSAITPGNQSKTIVYPPDASPLFTNNIGEYFDFHVLTCTNTSAIIAYWYTPAP